MYVLRFTALPSELDNRPYPVSPLHVFEGSIDLRERHRPRDQIIDLEFAFHVPFDQLGDARAALGPTKGGAGQVTTSDKVARDQRQFGARRGDADNRTASPTHATRLEGPAHDRGVPSSLEAVIHTSSPGKVQHLLGWVPLPSIDDVGRAEVLSRLESAWTQVHGNDFLGAGKPTPLDSVQSHEATAEYRTGAVFLHLSSPQSRTHTGSYSTANQAHFIQRCILTDLGQGDLRHDGVLGKG